MREKKNAYRVLFGKPNGRSRGRPVYRSNDNERTFSGFIWLRIETSGGFL
jgi:hypothetical protein